MKETFENGTRIVISEIDEEMLMIKSAQNSAMKATFVGKENVCF